MNEAIRRVTGTILGAPLTRRNRRELLYCGLGGAAGVAGFYLTVALLAAGVALSVSVIFTVFGLVVLITGLRFSRRLGALHRWLLRRLLGHQTAAPAPFRPDTGILARVDRRLRDRVAWRGVWYTLVKAPVAAVQLYAVTLTGFGLVDLMYPLIWLLFRQPSGHKLGPLVVVIPTPFGGNFDITSWPETVPAALAGAACVVLAAWLARAINGADRRLIRGLLGPGRVAELERTRALAVDDSAAALRQVERNLHDGAQMRLAALAMNLGMVQDKLGDDEDGTVRELIDAAHRNAVDALADLRDLARGIHPPVLDNGLASALESLAASSAIPATVRAEIGPRPAPAIETIAYFCAAELITNATKHSYANQITITMKTERAGLLRLGVTDDGIGGADQGRGSGLAGLAQRVSTVDGRIEVDSPEGGPTAVTVILPLRAPGGQ